MLGDEEVVKPEINVSHVAQIDQIVHLQIDQVGHLDPTLPLRYVVQEICVVQNQLRKHVLPHYCRYQ